MTETMFSDGTAELLARVRIESLFTKFSRGVDRGEWDLLRSCLFADATVTHGPFSGSTEEFIAWSAPFHDAVVYCQHFDCNIQIDFASTTDALVEVYVLAFYGYGPSGRNPGGTQVADDSAGMRMQILNRYVDHVQCREGRWGIAEHTFVHTDRMVETLSAPLTTPDGYLGSQRGSTDRLHSVATRLGDRLGWSSPQREPHLRQLRMQDCEMAQLCFMTLNTSPLFGGSTDIRTTIDSAADAGFAWVALDTSSLAAWRSAGRSIHALKDHLDARGVRMLVNRSVMHP